MSTIRLSVSSRTHHQRHKGCVCATMRAELLFGSQTRRHSPPRVPSFFSLSGFCCVSATPRGGCDECSSMNHRSNGVAAALAAAAAPIVDPFAERASNAAAVPQPARRSAVTATAPQRFANSPRARWGRRAAAAAQVRTECLCLAFHCGQNVFLRNKMTLNHS